MLKIVLAVLSILILVPFSAISQEEEIPDPSAYLEMKEKFDGAINSRDFEAALKIADEINEVVWPVQWEAMYNTARAFSLSGDRRKAYEYLYWAIDSGYWDARTMMADEAFAAIKEDKLFKKLARSARANGYIWMLEREGREDRLHEFSFQGHQRTLGPSVSGPSDRRKGRRSCQG